MTNTIGLLARFCAGALMAGLALSSLTASAARLEGTKAVFAHTRDKERIPIGSVRFDPQGGGLSTFVLSMDYARFADYFLSMKEFKCLDGKVEIVCHVAYPYANPRTVSEQDMRWLEHALLFVFKSPSEFGANLRNGLYFRFEPDGAGWRGRPQSIDLNHISAPPDDAAMPPYGPAMRDDVSAGERWIESVTIE